LAYGVPIAPVAVIKASLVLLFMVRGLLDAQFHAVTAL
jgi:hypothetical protein